MLIRDCIPSVSLFFALVLAMSGPARTSDVKRPWPLPIEINLTSSFAEFRPGHLHAGLDIKTYGREGIDCIAVGDGHISRMRASSGGYGKALYVTLDTGETAVYAHLAEFSPEFEAVLQSEQERVGAYRVDVYFEDTRFPVNEGDVIGYTGSTGASAPHLHFEFRDRHQNPMNPLSHGWSLGDGSAPAIKSVVFVPLDKVASINGNCRTHDVSLRKKKRGGYVVSETVEISGRVGLGAQIIDRLNPSSGRLAPYRVELTVDGVLLSSIEMERFTYGHTGEVELAYEMERARLRGDYFLMLFRRNGETLWNRTFQNDGAIDTSLLLTSAGNKTRVHTAVIRAIDRAGNVTVASIPFKVAEPTGVTAVSTRVKSPAGSSTAPMQGLFFEDLFSIPDAMVADATRERHPKLFSKASAAGDHVFDVHDFTGAVQVDLVKNSPQITAHVFGVEGVVPASHRVDALGVSLATSRQSLYANAFLYLSPWAGNMKTTDADKNGLAPRHAPVALGPPSLVLKKSVRLGFAVDAIPEGREAVYRLDERKNRWKYAGAEIRGDSVFVDVGAPGVYAVFVDTDGPVIATPKVSLRASYATKKRTPEVVIAIDDVGSGIDDGLLEIYINDIKRIGRWDGFSKKCFIPLRDPDMPIDSQLTVVAVDRVGNRSTFEGSFKLASGSGKKSRAKKAGHAE